MNATDRIVAALTPGSPFNANGLVWRSVSSLAQYAEAETEEVLELLVGNLAAEVAIKPSKRAGVGLLAALKVNLPAEPEGAEPLVIAGGPAFNAPEGGQPDDPQGAVAEVPAPVPPLQEEAPVEEAALPGMDPAEPLMD